MAEALKWRDAVKVVRGKSLDGAMQQANSGGNQDLPGSQGSY